MSIVSPNKAKKLTFDELILCLEAIAINPGWEEDHPIPIVVRECITRMRSMNDQKSKTEGKTPKNKNIIAMFGLTGFDDCVLGLVAGDGRPDAVAYDMHKVISKLKETMTDEEAMEYFEFNMVQGTPKENAPVFVRVCDMDHVKYLLGIDSEKIDGN